MYKYLKILPSFGLCLSLSTAALAKAETDCAIDNEHCDEVGQWQFSLGIGAGVRTNPLIDSKNIPLILIPQMSYIGERFFIQNLDVGVFLFENLQHQLNIFITPSYDPIYFHNNHPSNYFLNNKGLAVQDTVKLNDGGSPTSGENFEGENLATVPVTWRKLHKRNTAGLAGFEYNLTLAHVELQGQVVHDVTGVHGGDEVRLTLAKHWTKGKNRLGLALGANWQSQEVINYYYGVSARETDAANIYTANSGASTLVRFDWNYRLSEHWDLRFLASYRHLPTAISASPIVDDNKVTTAFVGGVYHF
jgi:MipA family protein